MCGGDSCFIRGLLWPAGMCNCFQKNSDRNLSSIAQALFQPRISVVKNLTGVEMKLSSLRIGSRESLSFGKFEEVSDSRIWLAHQAAITKSRYTILIFGNASPVYRSFNYHQR